MLETFTVGFMKSVETTFRIVFSEDQYSHAVEFVEDMKKHPKRVFWLGKKGKSDEELILGHISHRILSGFYNNYDPAAGRRNIISMSAQKSEL